MRYWYFPGCSLHSTAVEYDLANRAVCRALGHELVELEDWSCCGASSVHSLCSDRAAVALPARNVMQAQREPLDIAIPCADCYHHSAKADRRLGEDAAFRTEMEQRTGLRYAGRSRPRCLLELLSAEALLADLSARTAGRLRGLRAAAYYGCVLVRPPDLVDRWDDCEHPTSMDRILASTGAEPVTWSYGLECCGAGLAISRGPTVARLVGNIVEAAFEAGATCLVTACPMCQANLESRQPAGHRAMPVFYFTEIMGLALDLDARPWLRKHLVDPRPVLRDLRFEY